MTSNAIRPIADAQLEARIRARLDSLTKPPGSLGRLEDLVLQLGLIQETETPQIGRKAMIVFCADHGVVEEGVSPYPSEVTRQMVANFRSGGAAINVLCRHAGIEPVIVDMGVGYPTRNFTREAAMTRAQVEQALDTGFAHAAQAEILGAGEMGIGNTTSAAALFSAFSGLDPNETAGRGTGLDNAGVARKAQVIRRALSLHQTPIYQTKDPIDTLAALGGFEIAALTGLILGAASRRHLVMLDGFITGAAAIVARAIAPSSLDYVVFSHCSAEQAHKKMLAFLHASPLLNLDMRLGEGTGAALGIGLLESAVNLYREMATFQSAGVSTSTPPPESPSTAAH
jgi:nicotinate-nucleotide--dimethylbenzimidazole phosphoribosyltransferase